MPPKTPVKTPRKALPECPWTNEHVAVPGAVFKTPSKEYHGVVTGWNGTSADSVDVRFKDGSRYWFPVEEVKGWLAAGADGAGTSAAARNATAKTPERRGVTSPGRAPRALKSPPVSPPVSPRGRAGATTPSRGRAAAARPTVAAAAAGGEATPLTPRELRRRPAAAAAARKAGTSPAIPGSPKAAATAGAVERAERAAAERQAAEDAADVRRQAFLLAMAVLTFVMAFGAIIWVAFKVPEWLL